VQRASVPRSPVLAALAAGFVAGLLYGCVSGPGRAPARPARPAPPAAARPGAQDGPAVARPAVKRYDCCVVAEASPAQAAIAQTAARFIGAPRVEVAGRRLRYDCSGLARGVYLAHGIDLYDGAEAADAPNGVRLIWRHVASRGVIHYGPDPRPGDLVFFNNTWDRNGDGRVNDLLTHVGIVEQVEANGTVVFVTHVSRGIQRYRMNLAAPSLRRADDGRVLNDYLRRRRDEDPGDARYLTGELFAGFGRVAE
jgi:probable lipoprotein NlpC